MTDFKKFLDDSEQLKGIKSLRVIGLLIVLCLLILNYLMYNVVDILTYISRR